MLRGHESRSQCHDTVLRYAVTLQVCTHPKKAVLRSFSVRRDTACPRDRWREFLPSLAATAPPITQCCSFPGTKPSLRLKSTSQAASDVWWRGQTLVQWGVKWWNLWHSELYFCTRLHFALNRKRNILCVKKYT